MDYSATAAIFFCLFLLSEVKSHNRKVQEQWPNDSDKQKEFSVSPFGHYFMLIVMIGFLVRSIIRLVVK